MSFLKNGEVRWCFLMLQSLASWLTASSSKPCISLRGSSKGTHHIILWPRKQQPRPSESREVVQPSAWRECSPSLCSFNHKQTCCVTLNYFNKLQVHLYLHISSLWKGERLVCRETWEVPLDWSDSFQALSLLSGLAHFVGVWELRQRMFALLWTHTGTQAGNYLCHLGPALPVLNLEENLHNLKVETAQPSPFNGLIHRNY